MTSFLTAAVNIAALLMGMLFITTYFSYGNKLRAPASRSLTTMAVGFVLVSLVLTLRHPLNFSTSNSTIFTWTQIFAVGISAIGIGSLIWQAVKVHGRWPWQKEGR